MKKQIENFIDKLAKVKLSENATNIYSFDKPENEIRRNNLLLYFEQIAEKGSKTLLVGEAPGYQGCRLTGIPFCSEHILLNGIQKIGMFGAYRGYKKTSEYEKVWKEPSATIVWGAFSDLKEIPLLWASFPFHPHIGKDIHTNRAPTKDELEIGRPLLLDIIKIFNIERIIAVGNQAEKTLGILNISVPKIRHPSHGGKNDFVAGVKKYIS